MKRNILITFIFLMVAICVVRAQMLPLAFFQNNQASLINPSAWNMDILKYSFMPRHNANLNFRSQYAGIDRAPTNLLANYDFMPNQNILTGIQLSGDQLGPFGTAGVGLKYAHRVKLSKTGFLSGGVQAQLTFTSYDPSKLTDYNPADPFSNFSFNGNGLHWSAGLFYSDVIFNPDWQLCLGAAYLNLSSSQIGSNYHFSYLPTWLGQFHLYYFIDETQRKVSFLEGSILFRMAQSYGSNTDVRIKYQHKGLLGVQAGLRSGSYEGSFGLSGVHLDLNIPAGRFVKFKNQALDFNYSLEYPIGILSSQGFLSHELGLGLLF